MGVLRVCTQSRYISTFIVQWLTQKSDLGNSDWFAIAIHDPRYRPKSVRTLKKDVEFQGSIADRNNLQLE